MTVSRCTRARERNVEELVQLHLWRTLRSAWEGDLCFNTWSDLTCAILRWQADWLPSCLASYALAFTVNGNLSHRRAAMRQLGCFVAYCLVGSARTSTPCGCAQCRKAHPSQDAQASNKAAACWISSGITPTYLPLWYTSACPTATLPRFCSGTASTQWARTSHLPTPITSEAIFWCLT
jgi:hypothetical protein